MLIVFSQGSVGAIKHPVAVGGDVDYDVHDRV